MAHAVAHHYSGPTIPSLALDRKTGFTFVTLAGSVAGFSLARFALGLGEAGNFPASIKAVAEWFPRKERALATGIFNSGTNVGALIAPLAVPWITLTWGWEWAFIATGALGFLWLVAWLAMYRPPREHPRLSARGARLHRKRSDRGRDAGAVGRLLPHRQTWAFAVGKFMTDPVWWLYLYWVPDFLHRVHHIDLKGSALPIFVIYQIATIGSVAGGWLPARLLERGWTLNAARKTAMLVPAVVRAADHARAAGLEPLGGLRADRDRGVRAPGLVREYLHVLVGHVPEARGRIGRRHRRHGGRRRRHAHLAGRREGAADDRQLRPDFPDGRSCVPDGARPHPPARADHQAGHAQRLIPPTSRGP